MSELFKRFLTSIFIGIPLMVFSIFGPIWVFSFILLTALILILIYEWPKLFINRPIAATLLAPFYPILPIAILIAINHTPDRSIILFTFICLMTFDTAGYFFGKWFGKTKILPSISPGKSWEGFFAGIICMYLASILYFYFLSVKPINFFSTFLLILIFSVLSLTGDFFESFLKRQANLKDSSNLLPGHGGLLDRLDGVLFVSYFLALFYAKIYSYFF